MMQFCSFLVKFFEWNKDFFIKIEVVNKDDLLCWCNWHHPSVNFDENLLFRFKRFNKKDQIVSTFKKSEPNWK